MKTCNKCNQPKDESRFIEGRRTCEDCRREYRFARYAPIKSDVRQKRLLAYNSAGQKKCKSCNQFKETSEYKFSQTHWDKLSHICKSCESLAAKKRYDKSKHREESRKWYLKNRKKKLASNLEWRKKNPDLSHSIWHRYISRKRNVAATLTKQEWDDILIRYNHSCAYCHTPSAKLHKEHKVPVFHGGGYTASNIVPACPSCNSRKHTMTDIEFIEHLKQHPQ